MFCSKSKFQVVFLFEQILSIHIYYFSVDAHAIAIGSDFILSADPEKSYFLKSPIFTIVEAKRDDFLGGVPQCAAQMLGATYFNSLDGKELATIYGCVTDGTEWLFLKLENKILAIENKTYFTKDLEILLGVFNMIINKSL